MKGYALDVIAKWVILIVAALIAIGIILFSSSNIRDFINNFFQNDQTDDAIIVETQSFSSSQVSAYIKACFDKFKDQQFTRERICYVLKGDFSLVDTNILFTSVDSPSQLDLSKFDITKTQAVVKITRAKITLESL